MSTNLGPYHNAFYATSRDDLKYKKDREKYSFDIRFANPDCDIIIARSYATDIAVIDNKEKIMIMSKSRYSNTTGRQLDQLRSACPPDYKVIKYDCDHFGWMATHTDIQELIKKAGKEAREYLQKTAYKSKEYRDYNIALHNYHLVYGNNAFYKRKLNEQLDYEEKLKKKREQHPIVHRTRSEMYKIRKEKFEQMVADGVPRIIARYKTKFLEEEYETWRWDRSKVFIWSGKWKDKIKTTGGVEFEPRHAEMFKDFENYQPGQRVLYFEFKEIDDQDRFVIGCHNIPRKELVELREIWLKAKEKEENKKD